MNFLSDPCIDVIMKNGERKSLSIEGALSRASEIIDFDGFTPSQAFSIVRFFVALAQTSLNGPENEKEWNSCKDLISPKSIRYIKKYKDYFDAERFLQTGNVVVKDEDKCKGVRVLGLYWKEGNNIFVLEHPEKQEIKDEDLFKYILTFQSFSPSYMKTSGTSSDIYDSEKDGGIQESPCARSILTMVKGENLLETIWLNLITKEECGIEWGKPVWEYEKKMSKKDKDEISKSYLGRLVPLHRSIEINGEKCKVTQGIIYLDAKSGAFDSMVAYRKTAKKETAFLRIDEKKHAWRSLYLTREALVLKKLYKINRGEKQITIYSGGISMSKNSAGACKIQNEVSWSLSFPIRLLEKDFEYYKMGVDYANIVEKRLSYAISTYINNISSGNRKLEKSMIGDAKFLFWNELNKNYNLLFSNLNEQSKWQEFAIQSALKVMDMICDRDSGNVLKGFVLGKQKIILTPMDTSAIMEEIESLYKGKKDVEETESEEEEGNENE